MDSLNIIPQFREERVIGARPFRLPRTSRLSDARSARSGRALAEKESSPVQSSRELVGGLHEKR